MAHSYDAIVIGGGHNGLTTAAYLGRAGLSTLVLERRELLGGATVTEEIYPGFKYSVFSYLVSLLRPEVIHDLQLAAHGLMLLPLESTLNPLPGGDYLYRDADPQRTFHEIARHSRRDAEAYTDFRRSMFHMAQAMFALQDMVPPNLPPQTGEDQKNLAGWMATMSGLPGQQLDMLLSMFTMSAADFLGQWFESDALISALSTSSIIGSFVSPRSRGSAYVLLHHYMGEIDGAYRAWGFPKGGTGAVAEAIAAAARAFGAEIRTDAPVAELIVRHGRAAGVTLENGDQFEAPIVASSLAPPLTFLKLMDRSLLPDELRNKIENWQSAGCSGKVNLALDGLPEFACMPGPGRHLEGGISIAPGLDYLEAAFEDAKSGRPSRRPFVDMIIPSAIDPDMAPPGKHVMSCFVQYVPYELADGPWDDEKREAFGDTVVDLLEQYLPGISRLILHRQVLTPIDIERIAGIPGGNIFHGELSIDQLFARRPAAGYASYRTPVAGYYQCGSGAHPGGGISGAPGRLAARQILKDSKAGS